MDVPNKPDKMNKLNREITDYWSQKPWFSYQASGNLHELRRASPRSLASKAGGENRGRGIYPSQEVRQRFLRLLVGSEAKLFLPGGGDPLATQEDSSRELLGYRRVDLRDAGPADRLALP